MTTAAVKGIFLYGVVRRGIGPFESDGVRVYTIPYKDIACVASCIASPVDKNEILRLLIHYQRTIENVMEIIPLKFWTQFASEQEVIKLLDAGYGEFSRRLDAFGDKVEFDVTAFWDDINGAVKTVAGEHEIVDFKRSMGDTMDDKIKLGYMVKCALEKKGKLIGDEIVKGLKDTVITVRTHEAENDKVILNSAFLVCKGKEEKFLKAVDSFDKGHEEAVKIKCIGPLPPVNFATLEVKKISSAEVKKAKTLLGVEGACYEEINRAYRRLALKTHPDVSTETPDAFEEIKKAYELLEKCSLKGEIPDGDDIFLLEDVKI